MLGEGCSVARGGEAQFGETDEGTEVAVRAVCEEGRGASLRSLFEGVLDRTRFREAVAERTDEQRCCAVRPSD